VKGNKQQVSLVNRRFLRVKIFQALYAFYRTEGADLQKSERELFESVTQLNQLYLHLLALIMHVEVAAREILEANKNKKLPTHDDLNPNMRFVNNRVFKILKENKSLQIIMERAKVSWIEEHDELRKAFKQFKTEDAFNLYLAREDDNLEVDIDIIVTLFKENLGVSEFVLTKLEEMNIYWRDDLPYAAVALIKTIQSLDASMIPESSIIPDLYKNKLEDQKFVKELLRKTVDFGDDYGALIAEKAVNWETERIAPLDMLLMKMALCELEHFDSIPVKVSLNEYIELAKIYSTPKSKLFINGILDKLLVDLKKIDRISKEGRGLVE